MSPPFRQRDTPAAATASCCCIQMSPYVVVKMKRKKDPSLDGIEVINRSKDLRVISSLMTIMMASPEPGNAIPISAVSKMDRILEIPTRVATFLRRYPSFFEEFVGPQHNLPWFKPTDAAAELHGEEQLLFEQHQEELVDRVKRLIFIAGDAVVPRSAGDFTKRAEEFSQGKLRLVEVGDGVKWLTAAGSAEERILSALQRAALKKKTGDGSEPPSAIAFPLFPSKGVRLKQKIIAWLEDFQRIPYISPYEDSSSLHRSGRIAEKRLAGVLHELLSLFMDNSAERRKILCLRKHLGLSQKFYKAFEHHPHVFYLLLKNNTCTVVLKEPYCGSAAESGIEPHPLLDLRKKFVRLMIASELILRERRGRRRP
ncbi:unnamed protein product [Spirodela intermedia]|uniref:PORR domain-containing protein n=1 Tax=Spirodela intermedia TaxID=51605 RepID=A0A7I8JNL4_SPIIN|nr:unnamed protein product [Spirodela intermedia]CAA6671173.1 unnamed protein product [Spirodela intermedia]